MMLKKNLLCWLLLSAILVKTGEPFFVDIGSGVFGGGEISWWVVGGLCAIRTDGTGCLCSVRAIFGIREPCDARTVWTSVPFRTYRTADFDMFLFWCLLGNAAKERKRENRIFRGFQFSQQPLSLTFIDLSRKNTRRGFHCHRRPPSFMLRLPAATDGNDVDDDGQRGRKRDDP